MAKFSKPSKKTAIIAIVAIVILLIVAVTGTVVFLKDRGSTEAAQMDQTNAQEPEIATNNETQTEQNQENEAIQQETQTEQENNQETQTNPEISNSEETNSESNTGANSTVTESNGGTTGTNAGTSSGANSGASTQNPASTTDEIEETTISRVETVEIPERQISEGHYVGWTPMNIEADIASARINTTENNVDVEKIAETKTGENLVTRGEEITYKIKLTSDKAINGIIVKDRIPEKTTYVENSADNNAEKITENETAVGLIWNVDLTENDFNQETQKFEKTVSFKVKVESNEEGTISNLAIANGEEDEAQTSIITSSKEAKVEGKAENEPAKIGDKVTYTITVTNTGDVEGTTKVQDKNLEKLINDGILKIEETSQKEADELIKGKTVQLAGKQTITISFTAIIQKIDGALTNIATVGEEEPEETIDTVNITGTKVPSKTEVKVGEEFLYTITLKNTGNTMGTVKVQDAVPDGTEFVEAYQKIDEENKIAISQKELAQGYSVDVPAKVDGVEGKVEIVLVVKAVEKTENGDYTSVIKNTANIIDEDGNEDPIPSEDVKLPNITAQKASDYEGKAEGAELNEFDRITYTITLENHGKADGTVTITDQIPEGTEFVEGSIKVNGQGEYTLEDLTTTGIKVNVPKAQEDGTTGKAELTFKVTVKPFEQRSIQIINDKAKKDEEPVNPTTDIAKKEYIQIEGEKTWEDSSNQDGKRPNSITVILNKTVGENGEAQKVTDKQVTPDKNGEWKYIFENLPKYENGQEITYTIAEETVANYTTTINGYDIVNTYTPETIDISGQKIWDDVNDKDGLRPDTVTINLLANGVKVESTTTSEAEQWKYEFNNVPKYSNGTEIKYTISEEEVKGYTAHIEENSTNIVNKHSVPDVNIEKTVSQIIVAGTSTPEDVNETGKYTDKNETIYPSQQIELNDTIIYDIIVANTGNEQLTNVILTDDRLVTIEKITPIVNGEEQNSITINKKTTDVTDNLLQIAGVSRTIEAGNGYKVTVSYKVQSQDIANVDKMSNKAIVTSDEIKEPEDSTATVKVLAKVDYAIVKEIEKVNDTNIAKGVENKDTNTVTYNDKANKNDILTYKITIRNDGNTTINNLQVTDSRKVEVVSAKVVSTGTVININKVKEVGEDLLDGKKATLEPQEVVEITVKYKIGSMKQDETTENTLEIVNVATLKGTVKDLTKPDEDPTTIEEDATAIITANMQSQIEIHKTSKTDGDELNVGDKITYTVTLENKSSVTGKTTLKESAPENTILVSDVTVKTNGGDTQSPTKLSEAQLAQMENGTLELTVPGNGKVEIQFTVQVTNEALGNKIINQAQTGDNKKSEEITNTAKKAINIYETKTELGKQSVVLVVDMTLSLAADMETNNTDRLAYAPVNKDGTINYKAGYENTRWYKLKTALDDFVDSYLGDNIGNKRQIAIVGFAGDIVMNTGFMTSADKVKAKYADVFTQEQYTAAVKFAQKCQEDENPEEAFKQIFIDNDCENLYSDEKTAFKKNSNGTYVIDVDVLSIIADADNSLKSSSKLQSGTNIKGGIEKAEDIVKEQTDREIITNVVMITDGDDNRTDDDEMYKIAQSARAIRNCSVNKVKSKLYAIGFTDTVTTFEDLLGKQYDEYYKATNTTLLNTAFEDIKNDDDTVKIHRTRTIVGTGNVSLENITIKDNSVITIYLGNEITQNSTKAEFSGVEFKESNYYKNNQFDLRLFLIDYEIPEEAQINMQIYTVE